MSLGYNPNFNPFQEPGKILWKETIWLNFLRPACALPLLIFVLSNSNSNSELDPLFLAIYPIIYLPMVVPLLMFFKVICEATGKQLAPLLIIPINILFISGGDPLLFLLSKLIPSLVPIKDYPIFSFDAVIFVIKE